MSRRSSMTILTAASPTGGPLTGSVGNQGWNLFSTTALAPAGDYQSPDNPRSWERTMDRAPAAVRSIGIMPSSGRPWPARRTFTAASVSTRARLLSAPQFDHHERRLQSTSTGTLDLQLGGAPITGYYGSVSVGAYRHARRHAQIGHRIRLRPVTPPMSSLPSRSPARPALSPIYPASERFGLPVRRPPSRSRTSSSAPSPTNALTTTVNATDVLHPRRQTCLASTWFIGTRPWTRRRTSNWWKRRA